MSRRRTSTEIEMGSDSFLDIIANIVGILIILIVIAAIRVSQAPVPTLNIETAAAPTTVSEPAFPAEPEPVFEPAPAPDPDPEPVFEPEPALPEPPVEEPEPPVVAPAPVVIEIDDALVAEVEKLEQELKNLNQQNRSQSAELQRLQSEVATVQKKNGTLDQQLQQLKEMKNEAERKRRQLEQEQERTRQQIDQLTRVLEEVKQQTAPTEELRHEVTPVSKRPAGNEIHFQIKNELISVLPIDELIAEMKSEIPDNLNWIIKFNEYNGEVGPIRGFRMTYKVARESLSTVEQLQQGHGMLKVGVQRWELVQDELLLSETYEKALEPHSSFQAALMQADAKSTLTFWVYPDSFDTYQKIKEVAHKNGFLVAARPIPFGAPIAGSPNGTHSASQ